MGSLVTCWNMMTYENNNADSTSHNPKPCKEAFPGPSLVTGSDVCCAMVRGSWGSSGNNAAPKVTVGLFRYVTCKLVTAVRTLAK